MIVVDIHKQYCSCNFWGLVGIPCRHAIAALQFKKLKVVDYVHSYYSRDTYALCYGHKITTINGVDMWPATNFDEIQPPKYKKGPGRPKKLRRREPYEEETNATRLTRDIGKYKCKRCGEEGHNVRTCKLPVPAQASQGGPESQPIPPEAAPAPASQPGTLEAAPSPAPAPVPLTETVPAPSQGVPAPQTGPVSEPQETEGHVTKTKDNMVTSNIGNKCIAKRVAQPTDRETRSKMIKGFQHNPDPDLKSTNLPRLPQTTPTTGMDQLKNPRRQPVTRSVAAVNNKVLPSSQPVERTTDIGAKQMTKKIVLGHLRNGMRRSYRGNN